MSGNSQLEMREADKMYFLRKKRGDAAVSEELDKCMIKN